MVTVNSFPKEHVRVRVVCLFLNLAHSRTRWHTYIHKYVRIRKELYKSMVIISVNQKFNKIIVKFIEKSTAESFGHPGRNTCRSPIPLD